jgi:hypothetical protein
VPLPIDPGGLVAVLKLSVALVGALVLRLAMGVAMVVVPQLVYATQPAHLVQQEVRRRHSWSHRSDMQLQQVPPSPM